MSGGRKILEFPGRKMRKAWNKTRKKHRKKTKKERKQNLAEQTGDQITIRFRRIIGRQSCILQR